MANIIDATFRLIDEFTPVLSKISGEMAKFDPSKAGGKLEQNSLQLIRQGKAIEKAGKEIQNFGKDLTTKLTLPIATFGAFGVKTFAELQDSIMSTTARVTNDGDDIEATYERLESAARKWGAQTRFSALEVADAFNYMGLAGWDAGMMESGIEAVLNMAVASGEDLALVSDILTDGLTAFGYKASDIAKDSGIANMFADVLTAASTSSNTTIAQMGEAFKYAAPLAGALNFSVQDVGVALSVMANSGIKASQAGTSLRRILTNLTSDFEITNEAGEKFTVQTTNADGSMKSLIEIIQQARTIFRGFGEEQQKAIDNDMLYQAEKLGIEIRETTGELKDMNEIYELLGTHASNNLIDIAERYGVALRDNNGDLKDNLTIISELKSLNLGLSDAQKVVEAETIAQKTAMAGWLTLMNVSEEELYNLIDAINNCGGSAKRFAEIMEGTLLGKFFTMISALQEVAIAFGKFLLPYVEKAVEKITELATWFNNLEQPVKDNIMKFVLLVAVIGPLIFILGTIVKKVGEVITTFGKFGNAMKKARDSIKDAKGTVTTVKQLFTAFGSANIATAKILAVSIAIIALVGAIAYLIVKWDSLDDKTKQIIIIFGTLAFGILSVIALFKSGSKIINGFSAVMGLLKSPVMIIIVGFALLVARVIYLITHWNELTNTQKNSLAIIGGLIAMLAVLANGLGFLSTPITLVIVGIGALIALGVLLIQNWEKITATLLQWGIDVERVIENIKIFFHGLINFVVSVFTGNWANAFESAKQIASVFGVSVGQVIEGLFVALTGIIQFIVGVFTGNWTLAWEGIKNIFSGIIESIKGIFESFINSAIDKINALISLINNIPLVNINTIDYVGEKGKLQQATRQTTSTAKISKTTQSATTSMSLNSKAVESANALRNNAKYQANVQSIPKFAKGTDYFQGGIAQVSEKGGEILDLPRGTRIYPHDESVQKAYADGAKSNKSNVQNITVAKLADTIVVREDADIDKIANALLNKIRKQALNMA